MRTLPILLSLLGLSSPLLVGANLRVGVAASPGTTWVDPLSQAVGSTCTPSWLPLFEVTPGTNSAIWTLAVYDDGSGAALYAGGVFTSAGGSPAGQIAKWNGSSWSPLGSGLDGEVSTLLVYDDGGGPALYVGGSFTSAGGVSANGIAKWNGSSWSALGAGVNGGVFALAGYDDGSGPALYAGGTFTSAGGAPASCIARWNGSSWSALGGGVGSSVAALAVYDDGSGNGPALYVGGWFSRVEGGFAPYLALWQDGWLGFDGMSGPVQALTTYDDGNGPALYAGGLFASAGGVTVNRIGKWDGTSWTGLGSGMSAVVSAQVSALTVHDDGNGPALYAGGVFTSAGGVAASCIARWNGTSWSALGSGMNNHVVALTVYDDGSGPALLAGGSFSSAIDSGDRYLAKWGCLDTTAPTLFAPSSVQVADRFGSAPGELVVFSVTASDDRDPAPSVVCVPPSGSFFSMGTTLVTCTATDASGNQATCLFPVIVQPKVRQRGF